MYGPLVGSESDNDFLSLCWRNRRLHVPISLARLLSDEYDFFSSAYFTTDKKELFLRNLLSATSRLLSDANLRGYLGEQTNRVSPARFIEQRVPPITEVESFPNIESQFKCSCFLSLGAHAPKESESGTKSTSKLNRGPSSPRDHP